MSIRVQVTGELLDPYRVLAEASASVPPGVCGACASFIGTVRGGDNAEPLDGMYLEHYPGMAEREIEAVCRDAQNRWNTSHIEVWHRVGELKPGEPIVVVGVWSHHRAEAFDACRAVIGYLKERAPFWKREQSNTGRRWVVTNTPDHTAGP
jgi:molybdopterin synthase catalytic subunit